RSSAGLRWPRRLPTTTIARDGALQSEPAARARDGDVGSIGACAIVEAGSCHVEDHTDSVSHLLRALGGGDLQARDELLRVVYRELRRRADAYLRHERSDHTLQPTALVHEAYLRLTAQERVAW